MSVLHLFQESLPKGSQVCKGEFRCRAHAEADWMGHQMQAANSHFCHAVLYLHSWQCYIGSNALEDQPVEQPYGGQLIV